MSDKPLRIGVVLGGVEHRLTMPEWTTLIVKGNADWQKLRTKCPTCRCKVLPDETCWCCKRKRLRDRPRGRCGAVPMKSTPTKGSAK